ncbi:MAG: hypothetical protein ACYTEQ_25590 [Planctomycetota bacterium]|jgi:hypothetical protein
MKRTWVELTCDNCGCAEHFTRGDVEAKARAAGWIITKDGKHYDSKECYLQSKVCR